MYYPITSLLSVISIWRLLHINGMDKKSHQQNFKSNVHLMHYPSLLTSLLSVISTLGIAAYQWYG